MKRLYSVSMACLMVLSVLLTVFPGSLSATAGARSGSRDIDDLVSVNNGLTAQGEWATLRFVDLNKDAYLDIVGSTWWPNNGAGAYVSNNGNSWTGASTGLPSTGNYGIGDIGDVNEDTYMDFVIPYEHSQSNGAQNGIEVWKSTLSGGVVSWSHGTDPIDTGSYTGVALGDVNNDAHLDLAATPQPADGGIRFWQGDGGNTWVNKSVGLPITGTYNGILLVDLNKDGRRDIITTPFGAGFAIYTSNPDLSWTANSTGLNKAYNVWIVKAIDFDKDGNLDIVGTTDQNGFHVFTGNGGAGGTFQWVEESAGLPVTGDYAALALDNVDRDGNPDILTADDNAGTGARLYLGNGGAGGSMAWTRAGQAKLPNNVPFISADIADFNGDGTGDLLLGKGYTATGILCYKTIALASNRPTANAGADQTVYVGELVKLNGTGSTDDTGIKAYNWSITSQPVGSNAVLSSDTNVSPTFTPLVAGTYVLSLNVKDLHDQWALVEATVTVTAKIFPNAKPLANAGQDQNVTVLTQVKLNGSASWDDASLIAYNWNFTSKPADSTVTLNDETVVAPTFTPEIVGTYKFTLTVKDVNNTWSKNDEVVIVAKPSGTGPPTADAGKDETLELGNTTRLNGSASVDDTQIKLFNWSVDSQPSGSNLEVQDVMTQNITPPALGQYIFSLRVRDNDNLWSVQPDTVTLTVIPKDLAPSAKISQPEDKSTYLSTDNISFVGTESSDPEGSELKYQWTSSLDGDLGTEPSFSKNLSIGEHGITLSVTDDHGHMVSTTIDVRVKLDDLPVPVLSAKIVLILRNDKVTFDGSKSTDAQGPIASYFYDFGDGQNSGWVSSSQNTHQYKATGTFLATLKVKDNKGQVSVGSTPVNITVGDRPTAALSSDLTIQKIKKPIVFDASSSSDPEGTVVSYYYTFGDGTNSGWISNKTISKTYLTPGTYEVSVKVKDDLGFESINTAKVSVTLQVPKKTQPTGLGSTMLILILVLVIVVAVIVVLALMMRKKGKTTAAPVQPAPQAPPSPQVPPPVAPQPQPQYADQSGQGYYQDQGQAYDPNQYQGYDPSGQQYNQYQQPPQQ